MFMPMFYEINPKSWDDAKRAGRSLSRYDRRFIFRGQSDKRWGLKTSLERANEKYRTDSTGIWMHENQIIERFKTRANQFIQSPPTTNDVIEWLSIIQHYGGPTRLLDFTKSFYIASFFAIDSALGDACVWAINETPLANFGQDKTDLDLTYLDAPQFPGKIQEILIFAGNLITKLDHTDTYILSLTPSRLNERLSVQRGKFLFPSNIFKSFEENLCTSFGFPFNTLNPKNSTRVNTKKLEEAVENLDVWPSIVKINLSKKWHLEAIRDLYSMNIDAASLFPGLEGFARSLAFIIKDNYDEM